MNDQTKMPRKPHGEGIYDELPRKEESERLILKALIDPRERGRAFEEISKAGMTKKWFRFGNADAFEIITKKLEKRSTVQPGDIVEGFERVNRKDEGQRLLGKILETEFQTDEIPIHIEILRKSLTKRNVLEFFSGARREIIGSEDIPIGLGDRLIKILESGSATTIERNEDPGEDSSERFYPVPEDSILWDAVLFNRDVTEAPDFFTSGPMLAVAGKILTPKCFLGFGGVRFLNLYQILIAKPGLRKSTSLRLARHVAMQALNPPKEIVDGFGSDSAFFEMFEKGPHRLQIEDEGNTLIGFWQQPGLGTMLANRYLKLYDAAPWTQNFKNAARDDGNPTRTIEKATLSLVLAGTPGVAGMGGINSATGLMRRFGYYVAMKSARVISWPTFSKSDADALAESFERLAQLEGEFSLSSEAKRFWIGIQNQFRRDAERITGTSAIAEQKGTSYTEAPMRTLKLAAIMQACRWAKTGIGSGMEIQADTLDIAHRHATDNLRALDDLVKLTKGSEIEERARVILAEIQGGEYLRFTKTQLTSKFCKNPGRPGSITTEQLYSQIIPFLKDREAVNVFKEKTGKATTTIYIFSGDELQ